MVYIYIYVYLSLSLSLSWIFLFFTRFEFHLAIPLRCLAQASNKSHPQRVPRRAAWRAPWLRRCRRRRRWRCWRSSVPRTTTQRWTPRAMPLWRSWGGPTSRHPCLGPLNAWFSSGKLTDTNSLLWKTGKCCGKPALLIGKLSIIK